MANTEQKGTKDWEKPTTTTGEKPEVKVTKEKKPPKKEKDIGETTKQIEELRKQIEGLSEPAGTAASKIGSLKEAIVDMNAALDKLVGDIKTGKIGSFQQLANEIDLATRAIPQLTSEIKKAHGKIAGVLGTRAEETEEMKKWQELMAQKFKEAVTGLQEYQDKFREVAAAAVGEEGPMGMRGGVNLLRGGDIEELPKDSKSVPGWLEKNRQKVKDRLSAAISGIEEQDKAFGESWRDTWPIETLLATLYTHSADIKSPELREFQRGLREEYEDRRRVHDYFWMYQRCSGVEAILNMSAIIQKSAIERMVRKEGVGEAMFEMQGMLEGWDEQKKIKDRAREKKDEAKEKKAQKEMDRISEKIKRFGTGFRLDEKGNKIEDENAEKHRIAARMMVILGFTAQYGYTDFSGSGDFFIGRLLNLRDHMANQLGEGKRWQYRDKIINGFKQHLFFSGPLAHYWDYDNKKKLEECGIYVDEKLIEDKDGNELERRKMVKIAKPDTEIVIDGEKINSGDVFEKLRHFEIKGERREYWLGGAEFADRAFKADKGRALIRNTGQFLDRPTPEMFIELAKDFEHLSGRGRWEFFANLTEGFIDFNKGEGGAISRLLKGQPPATRHEITDPVTGEKKSFISFASSDAERMGIGTGWNSAQIDFFINKILNSTDLLDPAYAEWLKRKKLGFLGLPGVGPVRSIKEVYEIVRKNIFWALLAMILETLKASLPEELGIEEKKKKR